MLNKTPSAVAADNKQAAARLDGDVSFTVDALFINKAIFHSQNLSSECEDTILPFSLLYYMKRVYHCHSQDLLIFMFTLWLFNSMTAFTCWFQRVSFYTVYGPEPDKQHQQKEYYILGWASLTYLGICGIKKIENIWYRSPWLGLYCADNIRHMPGRFIISLFHIFRLFLMVKTSQFSLIKPVFYFKVLYGTVLSHLRLVQCDFWVSNKLVSPLWSV